MASKSGYLVIEKWMVSELKLKSTELLVYAIIYGFSQDGQGECWASLGYFELWTGANRRTIVRAIEDLEKRGLIARRRRVGTTSALRVLDNEAMERGKVTKNETKNAGENSVKTLSEGVTKCHGGVTKCHGGGDKMSHNNKTYNKENNKEEINKEEGDKVAVDVQRTYDLFISKFDKDREKYRLTPKRVKKIKSRLKDCGFEMIKAAIENTASNSFYRGDNDRGWTADLDFIIRSYEQVERLANMESGRKNEVASEDYWDAHVI